MFKWAHYNFIKIVLAISVLWTLKDNDVLNVSDYVAGQIRDHGIIGEGGLEGIRKETNWGPSYKTCVLGSQAEPDLHTMPPPHSYFCSEFKSNSTKRVRIPKSILSKDCSAFK